jgi:glycosyltransferase involved in cell wall biosynthesis
VTLGEFAPSVSVITVTYNQARFIDQCISSVIEQTYPNWDQFIIDDASTDDTAAAVGRWRGDPRIHYERQPHVGIMAIADTYNRALRATKGELVAILEGDDFWARDKLETLVTKFRDPDVVLAYGRTAVVVDARPSGRVIPDAGFTRGYGAPALFNRPVGAAARAMLRLGWPFAFPCSVVVRRSALDAIGGFQRASGLGATDFPTILKLATLGPFEYVDKVVAYWRRHPDSGSWATHQRAMHASADYARDFMRDHAPVLMLGPDQLAGIEHAWETRLQRATFNHGRYLLLQERWRDARERFVEAVRSPYPPIVVGGLVGYLASLLRTDIEGLMGAAGRVSFSSKRRKTITERVGTRS